MVKNTISVILIVLLLCVPASYFFREHGAKLMDEGRSAASFPELPSKISKHKLLNFFSDLDVFYADNFPLRNELIKVTAPIRDITKTDLDPKKCYRGIDNWLFLGNDYAHCVDKLEGTEPLPKAKLKKLLNKYTSIAKKCTDAGCQFAFIIGPNKSTIYPEFLPPTVIPAKTRYLMPLVDGLRKQGITIYDPTNDLWNAKKEGILYGLTDTHWNVKGSYVAFEGIRKIFNIPRLQLEHISVPPQALGLIRIGGYDKKIYPLHEKDNFHIALQQKPKLTRANEIFVWPNRPNDQRDKGTIKNAHPLTDQSIWVFTDSFSNALVPYITATFKEATFFNHKQFQKIMKSQAIKPNIILWVHVERNFI